MKCVGFFRGLNLHHMPVYDFNALDQLLDHLDSVRLLPVIEFMGYIFPPQKRHDVRFMWKDFTYQLVSHYLIRLFYLLPSSERTKSIDTIHFPTGMVERNYCNGVLSCGTSQIYTHTTF